MNKLKIAILLASIGFLASCKKYNQIDTSNTIKVPYVLYMGGQGGDVYKTNDAFGTNYNAVFGYDGSVTNQIVVLDSNILVLKDMVSLSQNEKSFHVLSSPQNYHFSPTTNNLRLNFKNTSLWDSKNNRSFLCSNNGLIYKSTDNGVSWANMASPTDIDSSFFYNSFSTSITQTENGNVYFLTNKGLTFKSTGGIFNMVIPDVDGSGNPINQLPIDFSSTVTLDSFFTISHHGNTLIAYNHTKAIEVFYSQNDGKDWYACTGIPTSARKLCGNQALGGDYFLGTDSAGLFKLDASGTNFVHSDGSLPSNARIFDVVGKRNVYMTNDSKYYIFAATNVGLYISENSGADWRLAHPGFYTALW